MNWFSNLFAGSAGSLVTAIGDSAKQFITTDGDRLQFQADIERLLQQRDSEIEQTLRAELGAKERMLVAELQQDDPFTKRARPMVVYAGLAFIGINYVLIPALTQIIHAATGNPAPIAPLADLPPEFWAAWGGICATWVIGRSVEKRGPRSALGQSITHTITGTPPRRGLFEQ